MNVIGIGTKPFVESLLDDGEITGIVRKDLVRVHGRVGGRLYQFTGICDTGLRAPLP